MVHDDCEYGVGNHVSWRRRARCSEHAVFQ
jgi:hypothetical protein